MRTANTRFQKSPKKYLFHTQGTLTKQRSILSDEPTVRVKAGYWVCRIDMDGGQPNNTNTLPVKGRGEFDIEVVQDKKGNYILKFKE